MFTGRWQKYSKDYKALSQPAVWPDWAKFCCLATFTWAFLHFNQNKQFQNMACCTYFNIQKHLGVDIWTFNLSFDIFGHISKNWAIFEWMFWSLFWFQIDDPDSQQMFQKVHQTLSQQAKPLLNQTAVSPCLSQAKTWKRQKLQHMWHICKLQRKMKWYDPYI
jgi:hypothetical protein